MLIRQNKECLFITNVQLEQSSNIFIWLIEIGNNVNEVTGCHVIC